MRTDRQNLPLKRDDQVMEAATLSTEYGLLHALTGGDHPRPTLPKNYSRPAANLLTIAVGRPTWQVARLGDRWPTQRVVDYSRMPLGALPTYLQEVSPRLALQMINAPLSDFIDVEDYPAIRLTGYGVPQDLQTAAYDAAGVVGRQKSHVPALLERGTHGPFATLVSRAPVVQEAIEDVIAYAVQWANAAALPDDYQYEPEVEPREVFKALLHEPWDGSTLWETPRLVLAQRLAICRAWPESRKGSLTAAQLMRISLSTGITPAAFLKYAVRDLARRKVTYVDTGTAYELAELADSVADTARTKVWAMQIQRAAAELDAAYHAEWQAHTLVSSFIRLKPSTPSPHKRLMPEWGWATTLTKAELGLA